MIFAHRLDRALMEDGPRIHMSKKEVSQLHSVTQETNGRHRFKPRGLWYGCGREWVDFVEREFESAKGEYVYDVALKPGANILRISNEKEFEEFEEKYVADDVVGNTEMDMGSPDWGRVAEDYDGIEICPYLGSKRLASMWYYGWDVSSGCIWNPRAIKELKLIGKEEIVGIKESVSHRLGEALDNPKSDEDKDVFGNIVDCPTCGTNKTVKTRKWIGGKAVEVTESCPDCGGEGWIPEDKEITCGACEGSGDIDSACSCSGRYGGFECGRCGNSGIVGYTCPVCDGDGVVAAKDWTDEVPAYEPPEPPERDDDD